ncbi:MAG: hypothetical protein ACXVO9_13835 [Bacteroidia bacterium]
MAQINLLMENIYDYDSRIRKERTQLLFKSWIANERPLVVKPNVLSHLEPPQDDMMWDEFGNPGLSDNQLL